MTSTRLARSSRIPKQRMRRIRRRATQRVCECVAFGADHPTIGQAIQVIVTRPPGDNLDSARLLAECRRRMPAYIVPAGILVRQEPLPRNPNRKIDRRALSGEFLANSHHADVNAQPACKS